MLTPQTDSNLPARSTREEVVVIGTTRYLIDVIDPPDRTTTSWAHPGVCVTPGGSALWAAPDGSSIRSRSLDGVRDSLAVDATECHGLAPDDHGGLWIADPGRKATAEGTEIARRVEPGRVTRVDSTGTRTHELVDPVGEWRPSGVALHAFGAESKGRVWVADGYGQSLVHCFSAEGEHLWTSDGADSGTLFQTPHGIIVDTRSETARLLIADRGNARIVVMTLEGSFVQTIGAEELTSPSNFALSGSFLWVSELFGAIRLLDADGKTVAALGDATRSQEPPWPNSVVDGLLTAPTVADGGLRAPHGIAAAPDGDLFVTEWIIGGKVTRFTPLG